MNYIIITILIFFTFPSFAQEIEQIIFTSQQADEPPTKQGRPEYTIKFTLQKSGELIASEFLKNKQKKKLKHILTIDKQRVETITECVSSPKNRTV